MEHEDQAAGHAIQRPSGSYAVPVDRSTLAWCTTVRMLADHHQHGTDRQALTRTLAGHDLAIGIDLRA
ncbi:hypothetical protein [Streptomyces sp. NPDC056682]|uniref:hypothetical protein n=1 Tax=Streptomyces sp. NPDC056682 TaxID=3345909 RepID=UPI0036B19E67